MVAIFKHDLWTSDREDDNIDVHCLMPNGNYISFKCPATLSLFEMKEVCILYVCLQTAYTYFFRPLYVVVMTRRKNPVSVYDSRDWMISK